MNNWQFSAIFFSLGLLRDLKYPEIETIFSVCAMVSFLMALKNGADQQ